MCTWIPLHRAVRAGSGNAARGTRRGGGGGRFASFRHARRDGAVQQVCVARLQHLQMTKSDLPRRNLPAVTLTVTHGKMQRIFLIYIYIYLYYYLEIYLCR